MVKKIYIIYITLFCVLILSLNFNDSKEKNVESTTSNVQSFTNQNTNTTNTCSICEREFSGYGYEEVSENNWQQLNGGQSLICSPRCGLEHIQNYNDILTKHGYKPLNESTSNQANNSYNQGNDGRIYENNACSLCKGTGIETGRNFATGENEGRICPMCDGRGVRSY